MSNKRLPTVVSDIPRDLRNFLDRIRELVSGDSGNRLVTAQDLVDIGVASLDNTGAITTNADTYVGTPPAPTNVVASAAINNIFVSWDNPAYYGHAYAEIWRSDTNAIGTSVKIGMSPGASFVDPVGPSVTRYYWVRFVNTLDVAGAYNAVNGVTATTGAAVSYLLTTLTNQLSASQLNTTLGARIDLIDGASSLAGSVNARVAAVSTRVDTLQGQVNDISATPAYSNTTTYAINSLVNYNSGIYRAKQSTTGNLPTNTTYWEKIGDYSSLGEAVAAHTTQISTVTNDLAAEVATRTTLSSTVNNPTTGLAATRATLLNDYYTQAATNSAISAATTNLVSQNTLNTTLGNYVTNATLTNNYYTSAQADTAISTATAGLVSSTTFNTTLSSYVNTSTLTNGYYTRTDTDDAISNATLNLVSTSTLAGYTNTAALQANYFTKASGQALEAQYTVKVDTNGYVSGFGLASTTSGAAATSSFAVRADSFYIASPSGPGVSPSMPFIVRTTGANAGVYLKTAFIEDLAITNAKIADTTIDSAKIVSLNASKITAGSLGVSEYIQSTNYVAGSQGFIIYGNGSTEFANTTVRGAVYASSGTFAGTTTGTLSVGPTPPTITSNSVTSGTAGAKINPDGSFAFGNSTSNIVGGTGGIYLNGPVVTRNLVVASGSFNPFPAQNGAGVGGSGNYVNLFQFPNDAEVANGISATYATVSGASYAVKLGKFWINTGVAVKPWEADDATYSSAVGALQGSNGLYGINIWADYGNFGNYIKFIFTSKVYSTWIWSNGTPSLFLEVDIWCGFDGYTTSFYLTNGFQWKVYKVR